MRENIVRMSLKSCLSNLMKLPGLSAFDPGDEILLVLGEIDFLVANLVDWNDKGAFLAFLRFPRRQEGLQILGRKPRI